MDFYNLLLTCFMTLNMASSDNTLYILISICLFLNRSVEAGKKEMSQRKLDQTEPLAVLSWLPGPSLLEVVQSLCTHTTPYTTDLMQSDAACASEMQDHEPHISSKNQQIACTCSPFWGFCILFRTAWFKCLFGSVIVFVVVCECKTNHADEWCWLSLGIVKMWKRIYKTMFQNV